MHNPRDSHRQAIKHILRYVKGTTNYGLFFKRDGSRSVVGYSDSSHNIDLDDGRSTELLSEILSKEGERVKLRIDNKSVIALTKNPVFHGRSKHVLKKYHFIRECVENGHIEVEHVPGVEQKADILTKPLARIMFKQMRSLIGVQEIDLPNSSWN
ncbi:hypothetical protein Bca4012_049451 [Brassica carinata]